MTAKKHSRDNCPYSDDFAVLGSDVQRMKEDIQEIKKDLKEFISTAEGRYATKQELNFVREQLTETRSGLKGVTDWIAKWGPMIAIIAYIALGFKGF
jgi:hypothetical protein